MVDSSKQSEHFEAVHEEYAKHYYDASSTLYRDQFINPQLFRNCDFQSANIAEIMCGVGPLSEYVLSRAPNASIQGFDISRKACQAYEEKHARTATALDITREALPVEAFDVIVVSGGIHHVAHHLDETFENIHRALKPGGTLSMFEPNGHYLLESARKLWYRLDKYFEAETEEALDYTELRRQFGHLFNQSSIEFKGGPAYYLVLNSMIFRVPLPLKRFYTPPLIELEKLLIGIPGPYLQCYFVANWVKR